MTARLWGWLTDPTLPRPVFYAALALWSMAAAAFGWIFAAFLDGASPFDIDVVGWRPIVAVCCAGLAWRSAHEDRRSRHAAMDRGC